MNKLDYIEASRDAVLLRARILKPNAAHPLAHRMTESGRLLSEIAEYFGAEVVAKSRSSLPNAAFTGGIGSSDFENLLSDVARYATIARLTEHSAHRAFCSPRPVPNFKQYQFPQADVDFALDEIKENAEATSEITVSVSAGLSAKLRTFGKNLFISDVVIRNDDILMITSMFANAGATAARLEASQVYGLLEGNPTLGDGEFMFDVAHGNVVAAALDFAALGAAMSALRDQRTPAGNIADLSAAFLIVASDLELTARNLVHLSGLEEIQVIASPWLAPGRWYLMASPDVSPVIGLLRLDSAPDGVAVGPRRDKIARAGVKLALRVDQGAVPLGRVGAIRGGL